MFWWFFWNQTILFQEDGAGAWESLDLCIPPNNPNFYQLAGLLSYGPSALGKHKICPRDGMPDCSIVDALRKETHETHEQHMCGSQIGFMTKESCESNGWDGSDVQDATEEC